MLELWKLYRKKATKEIAKINVDKLDKRRNLFKEHKTMIFVSISAVLVSVSVFQFFHLIHNTFQFNFIFSPGHFWLENFFFRERILGDSARENYE